MIEEYICFFRNEFVMVQGEFFPSSIFISFLKVVIYGELEWAEVNLFKCQISLLHSKKFLKCIYITLFALCSIRYMFLETNQPNVWWLKLAIAHFVHKSAM